MQEWELFFDVPDMLPKIRVSSCLAITMSTRMAQSFPNRLHVFPEISYVSNVSNFSRFINLIF